MVVLYLIVPDQTMTRGNKLHLVARDNGVRCPMPTPAAAAVIRHVPHGLIGVMTRNTSVSDVTAEAINHVKVLDPVLTTEIMEDPTRAIYPIQKAR